MSARIFISHASENANVADRIVSYLESKGAPCWISSRDISPKEIYAEAITQAMREAQSCIVIVSDASNGSAAVKRELELASRYNKPFIPVRIDATEPGPGLDYYLNNTQWVDYGRDRDKALDRVVAAYAARTGGAPASAPPPPPPASTRNPLLIPLIAAGAIVIAGMAWFALTQQQRHSGTAEQTAQQDTMTQVGEAMVGTYNWDGVACGDGPVVTSAGDQLIFTTTNQPTYRHTVLSADYVAPDQFIARTRVDEPITSAGQEYTLTLDGPAGVLKVETMGLTDYWDRCGTPAHDLSGEK